MIRLTETRRAPALAAAAIGFGAGCSPLLDGFYSLSTWAPLALVALVALMIAVVAGSTPPGRLPLVAAGALAALAVWQYASRGWAESAAQAGLEAQRTALYAAALGLLLILLRGREAKVAFLAGLAGGAIVAAGVEMARLLVLDRPDDFVGGRLNDPLGYTNGEAGALLLAFWPLVALAEWTRSRAAGALAVAAATVVLCLVLMTQSRAAFAALALSALLAVAALGGRARRVALLAACLAGVAFAAPPLLEIYDDGRLRAALPATDLVRDGVTRILLAATLAGAGWFVLGLALAHRPAALRRLALPARAGRGLAAIATVGLLAAAVVLGPPAAREVSDGWDSFRSLEQVDGRSRLTSVGGNRYDYWRIAVDQFRSAPLRGIGAGNYDTTYFRDRRTLEDVRQPHSVELQALAETGLIGLGLLAMFVAGVALAGARAARSARGGAERSLVVAACGGTSLWLLHTSVDWMHLLPGITLGALGGAAILLTLGDRPRPRAERSPVPGRPVVFALCALAIAAVSAGLLADHRRERARDLLATHPQTALERASAALRLDDQAVDTHYVIAAAYARLDRYADARRALGRAWALEPHDFVTPALLGDLAVRRGDDAQAARDYRAAARLNPLDDSLRVAADEALARVAGDATREG